MAVLTWYATNTLGNGWQIMDADPGTEAYASPVTGWIVSTGTTNRSKFQAATERAATTFDATTYPSGTLDTTLKDAWRNASALTGNFASGNWTVHFTARSNTTTTGGSGGMYCRLIKANFDGSSATEITAAAQAGSAITSLTNATTQDSSVTFNPGAFAVAGQFVFVQLAYERTGAGGMTTSDVDMRIGNSAGLGSRVVTADFTSSAVAAGILIE